ncbi:hypothetical protein MIND_01370500 [Mycena indigotica]|uniref:Uncharacterized protein n=1 Tax=Mycena indigotica TaxID=2126181 RepID=A0A8H6VTW8_9AGAR|nr:uncharacterized protein MIND_01370500 [Mycena indigotica]KAF7289953.1 hypothetical protein MIND_01370500 [Mycena indigotica]
MSMARAAESLRAFSVDILVQIYAVPFKPAPATRRTPKHEWYDFSACPTKRLLIFGTDAQENSEVMLRITQGFGEVLRETCQTSCKEAWTVLDLPIVSCLWIQVAGKMIDGYGNEENADLRGPPRGVDERSDNTVVSLLQPLIISFVTEDYLRMLNALVSVAPNISFFEFSAFPLVFSAFPLVFKPAMEDLTLVHNDIIFATLDLLVLILTDDFS